MTDSPSPALRLAAGVLRAGFRTASHCFGDSHRAHWFCVHAAKELDRALSVGNGYEVETAVRLWSAVVNGLQASRIVRFDDHACSIAREYAPNVEAE